MMITGRILRVAVGFLVTLLPGVATGQPVQNVVTMLLGHATVAHRAQTPQPLRFKDALFAQDRIKTAERSLVRVLLGGKALVTVRELSVLTITEETGRSSVRLAEGKLAASVVHSRMHPGEAIEIRTPNAIAAVRGTVVVVEVLPPPAPGATPNTLITVTRGVVGVTPVGRTGSAEVSVHAGQVYDVAADQLQSLTPDDARSVWADLVSEAGLLTLPDAFSRGFWRREVERTAAGTALAFGIHPPTSIWATAVDQALHMSPLSLILGATTSGLSGGAGSLGRGCGGGVGGGAGVGCAGAGQGGTHGN